MLRHLAKPVTLRQTHHTGFTHSAFVFGYESFVHKSAHNGKDIPPGALITFVQKGLQYVEMEAQVTEVGIEVWIG